MRYKHIFDFFKFCILSFAFFLPYLQCSSYFVFYPIGYLLLKYCLKPDNKADFIDDLLTLFTICIFLILDLFQCSDVFNILLIVYSNIIIFNYIIVCCYNREQAITNQTITNQTINNVAEDEVDSINVYINQLHQIETKPLDDWMCVICLENSTSNTVLFKCGHYYHKECIAEWININRTCPICKSTLQIPDSPVNAVIEI